MSVSNKICSDRDRCSLLKAKQNSFQETRKNSKFWTLGTLFQRQFMLNDSCGGKMSSKYGVSRNKIDFRY